MDATQAIPPMIDFYKRNVRVLLLIMAILLLGFAVFKIVRAVKRPANAKYLPGGGPIPEGWDPSQITDDIFGVIDGTFVSSNTIDQVYRRFNELNDNQIVDVFNRWLDKKYDQEKKYYVWPYGPLGKAIEDGPGYLTTGDNQKVIALANLKRLKLYNP